MQSYVFTMHISKTLLHHFDEHVILKTAWNVRFVQLTAKAYKLRESARDYKEIPLNFS